MRENRLYVVIPCYNEEEVLPQTVGRLREKMQALIKEGLIAPDSRVVFVDDGSKDRTWQMICALHREDPLFSGITLSLNRGHQNALLAGLMTVRNRCDCTISMDADLQDDLDAMDEMLRHYQEGCEIVYGVRSKRQTDSFFKRFTAQSFYRMMRILGAGTIYNHADYRLMSRRALEALAQYREVNLFLRGIVPMIGYKTAQVLYERHERAAGTSKYPLKKMVGLAFEGITSLSTKPIRMITWLGVLLFAVSILMGGYSLVQHWLGNTIRGWTSTVLSIWAVGGLVLFSLGIVGEYIGKIYLETKARPRYLVAEFLDDAGQDKGERDSAGTDGFRG